MQDYLKNIKKYFRSLGKLDYTYDLFEKFCIANPKQNFKINHFIIEMYLLHRLQIGDTIKNLKKDVPKDYEKLLVDIMIIHLQKRPYFDWSKLEDTITNTHAFNSFTKSDKELYEYQHKYLAY